MCLLGSEKDRAAGEHGSQGTLLGHGGQAGQAEESCRINKITVE
jgi:hypothetical protein